MVNGIAASAARAACVISDIQSTRNPKMSSANQMWSGTKLPLESADFAATCGALALQVLSPQIGFEHESERNE